MMKMAAKDGLRVTMNRQKMEELREVLGSLRSLKYRKSALEAFKTGVLSVSDKTYLLDPIFDKVVKIVGLFPNKEVMLAISNAILKAFPVFKRYEEEKEGYWFAVVKNRFTNLRQKAKQKRQNDDGDDNGIDDVDGDTNRPTHSRQYDTRNTDKVAKFQCDICKNSFSTGEQLHTHLKKSQCSMSALYKTLKDQQAPSSGRVSDPNISTMDVQYTCRNCNIKFSDGPSLEIHLSNVCTATRSVTKGANNILIKTETSSQKMPAPRHYYTCENCTATFQSSEKLNEHLSAAACYSTAEYTCGKCQANFQSADTLEVHMRCGRCAPSSEFTCGVCGKTFFSSDALMVHMQNKCQSNETVESEFTCGICCVSFSSTESLMQHIQQANCASSLFSCGLCTQSFSSESQLVTHMQLNCTGGHVKSEPVELPTPKEDSSRSKTIPTDNTEANVTPLVKETEVIDKKNDQSAIADNVPEEGDISSIRIENVTGNSPEFNRDLLNDGAKIHETIEIPKEGLEKMKEKHSTPDIRTYFSPSKFRPQTEKTPGRVPIKHLINQKQKEQESIRKLFSVVPTQANTGLSQNVPLKPSENVFQTEAPLTVTTPTIPNGYVLPAWHSAPPSVYSTNNPLPMPYPYHQHEGPITSTQPFMNNQGPHYAQQIRPNAPIPPLYPHLYTGFNPGPAFTNTGLRGSNTVPTVSRYPTTIPSFGFPGTKNPSLRETSFPGTQNPSLRKMGFPGSQNPPLRETGFPGTQNPSLRETGFPGTKTPPLRATVEPVPHNTNVPVVPDFTNGLGSYVDTTSPGLDLLYAVTKHTKDGSTLEASDQAVDLYAMCPKCGHRDRLCRDKFYCSKCRTIFSVISCSGCLKTDFPNQEQLQEHMKTCPSYNKSKAKTNPPSASGLVENIQKHNNNSEYKPVESTAEKRKADEAFPFADDMTLSDVVDETIGYIFKKPVTTEEEAANISKVADTQANHGKEQTIDDSKVEPVLDKNKMNVCVNKIRSFMKKHADQVKSLKPKHGDEVKQIDEPLKDSPVKQNQPEEETTITNIVTGSNVVLQPENASGKQLADNLHNTGKPVEILSKQFSIESESESESDSEGYEEIDLFLEDEEMPEQIADQSKEKEQMPELEIEKEKNMLEQYSEKERFAKATVDIENNISEQSIQKEKFTRRTIEIGNREKYFIKKGKKLEDRIKSKTAANKQTGRKRNKNIDLSDDMDTDDNDEYVRAIDTDYAPERNLRSRAVNKNNGLNESFGSPKVVIERVGDVESESTDSEIPGVRNVESESTDLEINQVRSLESESTDSEIRPVQKVSAPSCQKKDKELKTKSLIITTDSDSSGDEIGYVTPQRFSKRNLVKTRNLRNNTLDKNRKNVLNESPKVVIERVGDVESESNDSEISLVSYMTSETTDSEINQVKNVESETTDSEINVESESTDSEISRVKSKKAKSIITTTDSDSSADEMEYVSPQRFSKRNLVKTSNDPPKRRRLSPRAFKKSLNENKNSSSETNNSESENKISPKQYKKSSSENKRRPNENKKSQNKNKKSQNENKKSPNENKKSPNENKKTTHENKNIRTEDRKRPSEKVDMTAKDIKSKKTNFVSKSKGVKRKSQEREEVAKKQKLNEKVLVEKSEADSASYECDICSKILESLDLLTKHVVDHSKIPDTETNDTNNDSTDKSNKPATEPQNDIIKKTNICYVKTVHKPSDHSCYKCNITFQTDLELITHLRTHEKVVQSEQYVCGICHINLKSSFDLKQHILSHKVPQEEFVCGQCKLVFSSTKLLEQHMVTHQTQQEEFLCGICQTNYTSSTELEDHIRTHFNKNVERESEKTKCSDTLMMKGLSAVTYDCENCSEVFKNVLALHKHKKGCKGSNKTRSSNSGYTSKNQIKSS